MTDQAGSGDDPEREEDTPYPERDGGADEGDAPIAGTAGATPGGRGARRRRSRRFRVLRGVALVLAGVLVLAAAGLGIAYFQLNGNITGIDIDGALGEDRPEDIPNGSMDILVLGSDSRSGENSRYGHEEGDPRSDTAMVVHVHKDKRRASVVSIPRDTLVDRPRCERSEGGSAPPEQRVMFNAAYAVGGPTCAVRTVEKMTGIRMDHYLEVDFTGFRKLVDQLGGVKVTTSQPIRDKDAHLNLPAGTHVLDGEQALGLVRTRKGVGDGSDLGRIELQQKFLRALVAQIREVGVLGNPKRLYDLADAATSGITADSGLDSVRDLVGLSRSLRQIAPDDVQMATLPVVYDANEPSRVVPVDGRADQVWEALRHDQPIPRSATEDTGAGGGDDGNGSGGSGGGGKDGTVRQGGRQVRPRGGRTWTA